MSIQSALVALSAFLNWLFRRRKTLTAPPEPAQVEVVETNSAQATILEPPEVLPDTANEHPSSLSIEPLVPSLTTTELKLDEDQLLTAEYELDEAQPTPTTPASELSESDSEAMPTALPALPTLHPISESELQAPPKLPLSDPKPETLLRPPIYHPPVPPSPKQKTSTTRIRSPRATPRVTADLQLHVQLVFGRGGVVKTLALVPDRREGMPREVDVTGQRGTLHLTELSDDWYDPIPLQHASEILREGAAWREQRWRWVLSGRELYVLAPGDIVRLHGFVSTARLRLNESHVILATAALRDQVLSALTDAGCTAPELHDESTPGVPPGWILFRNVTPLRAVPMRDERDILNILCPVHDIEPRFVGGIRLERNIWLAGFPPRIQFTGELGESFRVMIDGQTAHPTADGAFEAPGWDAEGEHRLWFADRTETYSLRTMEEGWDRWSAYDFGLGAAICGAGLHPQSMDGTHWHEARVPVTNLLVVGAQPGEVFRCRAQHDLRSETIFALVPFAPIWALPINPLQADKRTVRLILLNAVEPISTRIADRGRNADPKVSTWVAAINDAGRKQLVLANPSEETRALWRRYRAIAKRLWKSLR